MRERGKCQGQEHWAGNAGLWREYIIGDRSSITFLPLRGHFVIEAASDEDRDVGGNGYGQKRVLREGFREKKSSGKGPEK